MTVAFPAAPNSVFAAGAHLRSIGQRKPIVWPGGRVEGAVLIADSAVSADGRTLTLECEVDDEHISHLIMGSVLWS